MWIRSQNREELIDVKRISVIGNKIVNLQGEDYDTLGNYFTKENAIKILDGIQTYMIEKELLKNAEEGGYWTVYEMPEEEIK